MKRFWKLINENFWVGNAFGMVCLCLILMGLWWFVNERSKHGVKELDPDHHAFLTRDEFRQAIKELKEEIGRK